MDLHYTRLISISLYNKTPLTKTWRYIQRKNLTNLYTLKEVYEKKLYNDIHAIEKALCLEELSKFFMKKRQFLINQCYTLSSVVYQKFPVEILQKICDFIVVPIKFEI